MITRGKIVSPKRIVIYAPEGIGKTTLASQAPNPGFIDIEGGTKGMDVARLPKPTSWTMLKQQVDKLKKDPEGLSTLVIDTADWAERLCLRNVCDAAGKASIEDFGYGKGFVMAEEEWGRFLDSLTELMEVQNMNIILLAHSQLKKFEQPDESGSYDRYELKLSKKLAPLTKEWCDALLFANYETFVVEDEKTKSNKALGGKRVIHTTHHVAWDAKNRDNLADKLQFPKIGAWSQFPADFFYVGTKVAPAAPKPAAPVTVKEEAFPHMEEKPTEKPAPKSESKPAEKRIAKEDPSAFPAALWQLMEQDGVTDEEVQAAVAARGYYPIHTPVSNYEKPFVDGVLVAAWPKVKEFILNKRSK